MLGIRHVSESAVRVSEADRRTVPPWQESLPGLLAEVEHRDPALRGHLDRVCGLSLLLGHRLGLEAERLQWLRLAAILHDVGKLLVPSRILEKPARLTLAELRQVRHHATHGERILRAAFLPWQVCCAVRCHHERVSGQGYPDRLAGEQIPLEARVLAVADAYDAMTAVRPYHQGMDSRSARRRIAELAGSHFDPGVVDHFLTLSSGASACLRPRAA